MPSHRGTALPMDVLPAARLRFLMFEEVVAPIDPRQLKPKRLNQRFDVAEAYVLGFARTFFKSLRLCMVAGPCPLPQSESPPPSVRATRTPAAGSRDLPRRQYLTSFAITLTFPSWF